MAGAHYRGWRSIYSYKQVVECSELAEVSIDIDAKGLFYPLFQHTYESQKQTDIFITQSQWPDDSSLIDERKQGVSRLWIFGPRGPRKILPDQSGGAGWRKYAAIIFIIGAIALVIFLIVDEQISGGEPEWQVTNQNDFRSLPHGYQVRSEFYSLDDRFIDNFLNSCETDDVCVDGVSYSVSIPYSAETINLAKLHLFTFVSGRWILVESSLVDESEKRLLASVRLPTLRNMVLVEQIGPTKSISLYRSPDALPFSSQLGDRITSHVSARAEISLRAESGDLVFATIRNSQIDTDTTGLLEIFGNSQDIERMLSTPKIRAAYSTAIVDLIRDNDYGGVVVNFGPLQSGTHHLLNGFISELRSNVSMSGREINLIARPSDEHNSEWSKLISLVDGLWISVRYSDGDTLSGLDSFLIPYIVSGDDIGKISLLASTSVEGGTSIFADSQSLLETLNEINIDAEVGAISTDQDIVLGTDTSLTSGNDIYWDEIARSVVVRIDRENYFIPSRFSFSFLLDFIDFWSLKGLVIDTSNSKKMPEGVVEVIAGWFDTESIQPLEPFGPYLQPCWIVSAGSVLPECWSTDGGDKPTVWTTPATPGVYALKLIISDGELFISSEEILRVDSAYEVEATATATPEATATATPEASATATPEASATATPEATATATPEATATATPEATATATPEATATATPEATATATPEVTATPEATAAATPETTATPTATATPPPGPPGPALN